MSERIAEKVFPAELNQMEPVQEFVHEAIANCSCPVKTMYQLDVAIEEIFVNIAHYAYKEGGRREAVIQVALNQDNALLTVTFMDWGTPFDPLAKPDADTTLSAEERDIGGLGILMVKKSMDSVDYEYRDGMNVLTITKSLKADTGEPKRRRPKLSLEDLESMLGDD